jgi:hypothetical protein
VAYSLKCPACRVKFKWDPTRGFPDHCPNPDCTTRIAHDRDDSDVVMPFVRSAATTANDSLYRRMEQASERRVGLAAAKAGVPMSDMADLKITNLRDTRSQGDVAAVPVSNPVTQFMQQNPNAGGFRGDTGVGYSGAVMTGPEPNRGARVQSMVRQMHAEGMGWDKVGDRPALETQQPNYRRRV